MVPPQARLRPGSAPGVRSVRVAEDTPRGARAWARDGAAVHVTPGAFRQVTQRTEQSLAAFMSRSTSTASVAGPPPQAAFPRPMEPALDLEWPKLPESSESLLTRVDKAVAGMEKELCEVYGARAGEALRASAADDQSNLEVVHQPSVPKIYPPNPSAGKSAGEWLDRQAWAIEERRGACKKRHNQLAELRSLMIEGAEEAWREKAQKLGSSQEHGGAVSCSASTAPGDTDGEQDEAAASSIAASVVAASLAGPREIRSSRCVSAERLAPRAPALGMHRSSRCASAERVLHSDAAHRSSHQPDAKRLALLEADHVALARQVLGLEREREQASAECERQAAGREAGRVSVQEGLNDANRVLREQLVRAEAACQRERQLSAEAAEAAAAAEADRLVLEDGSRVMMEDCRSLRARVSEVEGAQTELMDAQDNLREECDGLRQERDAFRGKLSELEDNADKLAQLESQLLEVRGELLFEKAEFKRLEAGLREELEDALHMAGRGEENLAEVRCLRGELEDALRSAGHCEEELAEARRAEHSSMRTAHATSVASAAQMETLQEGLRDAQLAVSQGEAVQEELRCTIQKLEGRLQDSHVASRTVEKELEDLRAEVAAARAERESHCARQHQEAEGTRLGLELQVDTLERKLTKVSAERDAAFADTQRARAQVSQALVDVDEVRREAELALEEQVATTNKISQDWGHRLEKSNLNEAESRAEVTKLAERVAQLEAENTNLGKALERSNRLEAELRAGAAKVAERVTQLEAENASLRDAFEGSNNFEAETRAECVKFAERVAQLEAELASASAAPQCNAELATFSAHQRCLPEAQGSRVEESLSEIPAGELASLTMSYVHELTPASPQHTSPPRSSCPRASGGAFAHRVQHYIEKSAATGRMISTALIALVEEEVRFLLEARRTGHENLGDCLPRFLRSAELESERRVAEESCEVLLRDYEVLKAEAAQQQLSNEERQEVNEQLCHRMEHCEDDLAMLRSPQTLAGLPQAFLVTLVEIHAAGDVGPPHAWPEGFSPLHWAAQNNRRDIIEYVLRRKGGQALLRSRDSQGKTPLAYSMEGRQRSTFYWMRDEAGYGSTSPGGTPHHRYSQDAHEMALLHQTSVESESHLAQSERGPIARSTSASPAESSLRSGYPVPASESFPQISKQSDIPPAFLQVMEDIDRVGWESVRWTRGFTLLHWAAKMDLPDLCNRFLLQGAERSAQDDCGKSPLDLAREAGSNAALAVLQHGPTGRASDLPSAAVFRALPSRPLLVSERSSSPRELVDGPTPSLRAEVAANSEKRPTAEQLERWVAGPDGLLEESRRAASADSLRSRCSFLEERSEPVGRGKPPTPPRALRRSSSLHAWSNRTAGARPRLVHNGLETSPTDGDDLSGGELPTSSTLLGPA